MVESPLKVEPTTMFQAKYLPVFRPNLSTWTERDGLR